MVVTKIEFDNSGWVATIIDGYLCEREKLIEIWREIYRERRNKKLHFPKNENIEYIAIGAALEAQLSSMHKVGCNLKNCYLSIFRTNENNIIKQPYSQLYIEEHIMKEEKYKDSHFLLHVSKDCKYSDSCLKNIIKLINFGVKKREDYYDFKKYCESVENLLEREIFLAFISPDTIVKERLLNLGFYCRLP